ncbi:MAG: hypothetical protein AB8B55_13590 [Mariniblastus sp.]
MTNSPRETVLVEGNPVTLSELSEFGFTAPVNVDTSGPTEGTLLIGNEKVEIEFRIRGKKGDETVCSFANFSISNREKIKNYLRKRDRVSTGNEELEQRTYDELAKGIVSSAPAAETESNDAEQSAAAPKRRSSTKSLALLLLLFAMVGLAVLASVFLKSRSSLAVGNSALVGNYLPINAKVEGEIEEFFV